MLLRKKKNHKIKYTFNASVYTPYKTETYLGELKLWNTVSQSDGPCFTVCETILQSFATLSI